MAVEEDEDKRVFFWFGNEGAVDSDPHRARASAAKSGPLLTRLLKVPAKKSPIGLFSKPAPTQEEVCPLVKDKLLPATRIPKVSYEYYSCA